MIQGTSSSVGKSLVVTALCRIFHQDGLRVAPFKAQNMALNSFVTPEGGEIGRAQAVQAEAAGVMPTVRMNPILLKPEATDRSQVIVLGHPDVTLAARDYYERKASLWGIVTESLDSLTAKYDVVVIEGAGSPAEVNLKEGDIVNMRVARYANAPVLLVGDVDRGGVFASLIGTLELLEADERNLVKGFVINKFRGNLELLKPGLEFLEQRTDKPVIGVIPYCNIPIAQEDSVYLDNRPNPESTGIVLDVAVIWLPHISNYDDFDPLEQEEGVGVRFVRDAMGLGRPDLIILPGTKSTMSDLTFIQRTGLGQRIIELASEGTPIIGICGGYQMLGREIRDPQHVEDGREGMAGLGLLPTRTCFAPEKITRQVQARIVRDQGILQGCQGMPLSGYEIHMGGTEIDGVEHVIEVVGQDGSCHTDGAIDQTGWIFGCYLHGIFDSAHFRRTLLAGLASRRGQELRFSMALGSRDQNYDRLADLVRGTLDMDRVRRICGL